jgi:nicotinamidase-related amidase
MLMSNDTALLVIDVQVGLVEGAESAYRGAEMLANINRLLAKARTTGIPVIYIQHDGSEAGRLAVGSPGWQIHPAITPIDGEAIVRKRASDAFHETILQRELESRSIKRLVITGMKTEYCVDTTSRRAISLGFDVVLVGDAHATTDSEALPAKQIIRHHNDTLDGFGTDDHEITVQNTDEVIL